MAVTALEPVRPAGRGLRARLNRLLASPGFQARAARLPFLRRKVRREGEALFDLVAGFVQSQALLALVELRLLHALMDEPRDAASLAPGTGIAPDRMEILLQAGAALGLLQRLRDGRFALAPRGAAMLGVPGLEPMIRHHHALYADLADPVALLRGESPTRLAQFWPYVFGGDAPPEVSRTYSGLMAESQGLVAADVLRMVDLSATRVLLDVGGGTGAFVEAVARAHPRVELVLFDLPSVIPEARRRLVQGPAAGRFRAEPGSFRTDPLPQGADTVSLVRVLYDHDDDTVSRLLAKVHAVLPPGGRLVVAEPMSGGDRPERAGDVYFAFYTMAMQTGRTRSAARIAEMCRAAGFGGIAIPAAPRPFVTSALTAIKTG